MIISLNIIKETLENAGYDTVAKSTCPGELSEDVGIVSSDKNNNLVNDDRELRRAVKNTYNLALKRGEFPTEYSDFQSLIVGLFKYSMLEIHQPSVLGGRAYSKDDAYYYSSNLLKLNVL